VDQVRHKGPHSETLFIFDGVVLEIFGLTQVFGANHLSLRFHRDLMTITIEEPDRKGGRKVEINAGGLGPVKFAFAEQDQPVIDFLERVRRSTAHGRLAADALVPAGAYESPAPDDEQ
jgi:hypothetical protein